MSIEKKQNITLVVCSLVIIFSIIGIWCLTFYVAYNIHSKPMPTAIQFVRTKTSTATLTFTPTQTRTLTPTTTNTVTSTKTVTPTLTNTPVSTNTQTVTPSPTQKKIVAFTPTEKGPCDCYKKSMTCLGDFDNDHERAQTCYNYCISKGIRSAVERLDRDKDGLVCEE